jgi:hypothetical protein
LNAAATFKVRDELRNRTTQQPPWFSMLLKDADPPASTIFAVLDVWGVGGLASRD